MAYHLSYRLYMTVANMMFFSPSISDPIILVELWCFFWIRISKRRMRTRTLKIVQFQNRTFRSIFICQSVKIAKISITYNIAFYLEIQN